jgi:quercetin dioxygenase-like cupin family protein
MEKTSLTALAREHLDRARAEHSGRSAHTVYGGHEHALRQTLIGLTAGTDLAEHVSPGEATLQVLHGRVRMSAPGDGASWEGAAGDHLAIPRARHSLHAVEDSAVLLTVVKDVGPHT